MPTFVVIDTHASTSLNGPARPHKVDASTPEAAMRQVFRGEKIDNLEIEYFPGGTDCWNISWDGVDWDNKDNTCDVWVIQV